MSDIFSSISPFAGAPSCDIPSPLPTPHYDFIEGIPCPPSGCSSSISPDPNLPYTFLDCYIVGLSGKLGIGGEESSVSVELVDPNPKNCSYTDPSCSGVSILSGYSGALGGVYTIQIGGFSFRGILTNHDYKEGSDGWRYTVTLSDGKQVLSNVNVIVNGFYSYVNELQPNLINAVAIKNASVANELSCENIGTGNLCENFGEAGINQKGMYAFEAITAINQQKCKIPVSGLCLTIDLSNLITLITEDKFNKEARLSSDFMTALEIIDYACNESGYGFFTQIIDDKIIVIPVSQKVQDLPLGGDSPLFDFMNQFDKNIIIDRDYGEQMTFNKSQKLVLGAQYRYMLAVDNSGFACGDSDYIQLEPIPSTGICPAPGDYQYLRTKYDYFSGGGLIIGDIPPSC
jgi:hypothetical protein